MTKSAVELLREHGIAYQKTQSGKWTTSCPQCDGGYLSVKVDNKGAVWHCASCKWSGPPRRARSAPRLTNTSKTKTNGNAAKKKPTGKLGPIIETHDYTDEHGK